MSDGSDASGEIVGGRYRLRRQLGHGGMGIVYEAWQEDLKRSVALKLLRDVDPEAVERFRREAQAAAALGSPHIVQIFDFQMPDGEPPFLVMELLEGQTLSDAVRAGERLAPARVARIGVQVLAALEAAHNADLLHRDIKPANIFLSVSPTLGEVAKILDFGIVKLQSGASAGLTATGAMIGTLTYMSPEQARGLPLDGRTDVYALGVSLYYALSGQRPFPGESAEELIAQMIVGSTIPLREVLPGVDPALARIIEKGTATDRAERYASAREMGAALSEWSSSEAAPGVATSSPAGEASMAEPSRDEHDETPRVAPASTPQPGRVERSRGGVVAWAIIGLALLVGAVAWAMAGRDEPTSSPASGATPAHSEAGTAASAVAADASASATATATTSAAASSVTASAAVAAEPASPTATTSATAPAAGSPGASCIKDGQCRHGTCVQGRCVCTEIRTQCGNQCVYLKEDWAHCGACSRECQRGEICQQSRCVACADLGRTICGTECVDTRVDHRHCGTCFRRCPIGQFCVRGDCRSGL